jgi:hypothetical protein
MYIYWIKASIAKSMDCIIIVVPSYLFIDLYIYVIKIIYEVEK